MSEYCTKKEVKALINWTYWTGRLNKLEAKGVRGGALHARFVWNVLVANKVLDSQFLDGGRVKCLKLHEKEPFPAQERENLNNFQKRLAKKANQVQDNL